MKRLKIVLQSNYLYIFLITICLFYYLVASASFFEYDSKEIKEEKYKITSFSYHDYGLKLNLRGKTKAIGYIYDEFDIYKYCIGDTILINGKTKEIKNSTVLNTFDYKKYLKSNKIERVIEIKDIKIIKKSKFLYKVKDKLYKRSFKLEKSYPYINSLILGNNNYIDKEVLNLYKTNGIMHIFSISGLHISTFIYMISILFKRFKYKNIIIVLFLVFYMFLTNFSMSVARSSIFAIISIINNKYEFRLSNIKVLLLTLIIILLINPLYADNIGFKYSFVISLFILKFSKNLKGSKLVKSFKVSIIAFLASYPITINSFYEINFLSIFYNVFFIIYLTFILLPMTIISYFIPFFDKLLYFFIRIIELLNLFLESITILKFSFSKLNIVFVFIYYMFVWFMLKSFKKKHILIIIFFLIIHYHSPLISSDYVMFLDVGQGDSFIVKINNNVTMIDTGGLYNEGKIVENKLIPYLKGSGIKKINTLILSHGDFDHMGEAKYLVNNFKVEKVIFNCGTYNDLEKELIKVLEEKNVKYYRNINELKVDDTKLYFLNTKVYDNENDDSNVIYFELNNKKLLLMGDAGIVKEQDILDKYNIENIDVLKVGHHGSNTSSSKEFIDRMNPKYSVISVGKNNRYGHPNKEVLDNLKYSKVYRTDQDGSIMLKIKNNKLKIETCSP